MSLISKWWSTTLAFGTDDQNTPEVNLQDSFEAIEIDIPTIETAELQIKGSNSSGGTFDLIGQEEPVPSSTGGFRTTVPLGGKYQFIKVYLSAAQTADRVFAVRGISYAAGGLVTLIDRIKNMRVDIGDIEVNTQDIEDALDAAAAIKVTDTMYGQPTLFAVGNGKASWLKTTTPAEFALGLNQKGSTGWVAKLFGGIQAGYNDAAMAVFPVNELLITAFNTAQWTYYMTNAELFGCQIQISIHDPLDNNKRADVIQSGATPLLAKAQGWNSHVFNKATPTQFFYYAENEGSPGLTEGPANLYSWAQFQADTVFKTWTIYRITLNNGFYTGDGNFESTYLADVEFNGQRVELKPSLEEQLDMILDSQAQAIRTTPAWTFGEPFLRDSVSGNATWSRWHHQKGAHGWTAILYGGIQTSYDDWARICIPVNEMLISDLKSALWTWNNTEEEANGLGMVIYIHDPDDNDLRIEITQLAAHANIEKAAGWLAHELNVATDYFYWYGEDGPTPGGLTEGVPNYYGLDDFQADALFGRWTIYRIDFYWGGQTGSEEYKDIWVADIKINGQAIPIKPDSSGTGRFGIKTYTGTDATVTTGEAKLAPKTPYRLLSISNKISAAHGATSPFVVNLLSEAGAVYDATLLTDDMYVPTTRKSLYAAFGQGYEFGMDDELDIIYTNNGGRTYGIVYRYEVLV